MVPERDRKGPARWAALKSQLKKTKTKQNTKTEKKEKDGRKGRKKIKEKKRKIQGYIIHPWL